jgi:hypothetical protein
MMRRVALAGVIAAVLSVMFTAAGPASAGTSVGCLGPSCSVSLSQYITLGGSYGSTGSAGYPIAPPPPPCLWQPMGDTLTGARTIVSTYPNPTPALHYDVYQSVRQAQQQLKAGGPPGTWYQLPVNPAASPTAQAKCLTMPLYVWQPPGQVPPMPPIPPRILADYAYNHMLIPSPSLTLSPVHRGIVNLASYVWLNWPPTKAGTPHPNGAYSVTASLGNQAATVWARPEHVSINPPADGTAYSSCGTSGSKYPPGQAPSGAGAGQPPDCGVLWTGPTSGATVRATVTFSVTWGRGILNGPGPNALHPITITSQPVTVPVAEIQNLNG